MDIGVEEIRLWHTRDNGWKDIGYHWVIRRDGTVEAGRAEDVVGAHASGHNHDSIGICLVGGMRADRKGVDFNFTAAQVLSLLKLVDEIEERYGPLVKVGHRDVAPAKECPGLDVASLLACR